MKETPIATPFGLAKRSRTGILGAMARPLPYAPVHHCRSCGAPVDPLEAAAAGGLCGRPACRAEALRRSLAEERRIAEGRRARGRAALVDRGSDPDAGPWSVVPFHATSRVPLPAERRRAFLAHLRDRIVEAEAHPGPVTVEPVPPGDAEGETFARACAACRGWCCLRGGAHAFIDAASLARIRRDHPGLTVDELEGLYASHLGDTHLDGGCVFQAEDGCRLPRTLRSDTCLTWLCEDLVSARERWRDEGFDPRDVRFVAIPTGRLAVGPPDAGDAR